MNAPLDAEEVQSLRSSVDAGLQRAANVLSRLFDGSVRAGPSELLWGPWAKLHERWPLPEGGQTVVLSMTSGTESHWVLSFDAASADALCTALLGSAQRASTEMGRSALMEVANIAVSAFLGEWADRLGVAQLPSAPRVMGSADEVSGLMGEEQGAVLVHASLECAVPSAAQVRWAVVLAQPSSVQRSAPAV